MDDLESFQQQALELCPIGDDFDPEAEPQNGDEFLMRMLYERKHCPAVVVRRPKNCTQTATATILPKLDEPTTPVSLLPTAEWKSAQSDDFCATRDRITALRRELTASRYENALEPPLTKDEEAWHAFCRDQPPLLSTTLRLNQRTLEQLLEWLCEWLRGGSGAGSDSEEEDDEKEEEEKVATVSSEQLDLSCRTHWYVGAWLYAVLACLHLPLEPQSHSTLRDIARVCLSQRGRLQPEQWGQAVPYNLFIHLISRDFGQLDFASFV